jgi:hypothetical protein
MSKHSYDEEKKGSGLIGLSLWLFILFWIFLPPPIQTVTVYRLSCPDVLATGDKCEQTPTPTKSIYRVFIEQQIVVAKNTMTSYDDCDVFDRNNWECHTPQTTISIKNGKELFLARSAGYSSTQLHAEASKALQDEAMRNPQVPVWTWYYHYITGWIRSF